MKVPVLLTTELRQKIDDANDALIEQIYRDALNLVKYPNDKFYQQVALDTIKSLGLVEEICNAYEYKRDVKNDK